MHSSARSAAIMRFPVEPSPAVSCSPSLMQLYLSCVNCAWSWVGWFHKLMVPQPESSARVARADNVLTSTRARYSPTSALSVRQHTLYSAGPPKHGQRPSLAYVWYHLGSIRKENSTGGERLLRHGSAHSYGSQLRTYHTSAPSIGRSISRLLTGDGR